MSQGFESRAKTVELMTPLMTIERSLMSGTSNCKGYDIIRLTTLISFTKALVPPMRRYVIAPALR